MAADSVNSNVALEFPQCGFCWEEFDTDLSLLSSKDSIFGVTNNKSHRLPVSCLKCSYSICGICLRNEHRRQRSQQNRNRAGGANQQWLACPSCRDPRAIDSTNPFINRALCRFVEDCRSFCNNLEKGQSGSDKKTVNATNRVEKVPSKQQQQQQQESLSSLSIMPGSSTIAGGIVSSRQQIRQQQQQQQERQQQALSLADLPSHHLQLLREQQQQQQQELELLRQFDEQQLQEQERLLRQAQQQQQRLAASLRRRTASQRRQQQQRSLAELRLRPEHFPLPAEQQEPVFFLSAEDRAALRRGGPDNAVGLRNTNTNNIVFPATRTAAPAVIHWPHYPVTNITPRSTLPPFRRVDSWSSSSSSSDSSSSDSSSSATL